MTPSATSDEEDRRRRDLDERLEEALKESFPASDAPAVHEEHPPEKPS